MILVARTHFSNDKACSIRLCGMSLQTYIPALYHKVKLLHKQILHDQLPSLTNLIASVYSSNQSSILPCPNPHHPVSFTAYMWKWTRPWVLNLPCCSLVQSRLATAALCWTSYFAPTDTRVKIWWSGLSKCSTRTTFAYDFAALAAVLDFSLTVLSLFSASWWWWSSDSWSRRWHIESSTTERNLWLSMLWSWTRSHRQCWPWLANFAPIFIKASNVVSTIRSSNNLYRTLRDDQVGSISLCSSCFCQVWSLSVLSVDRLLCPFCSSSSLCALCPLFVFSN